MPGCKLDIALISGPRYDRIYQRIDAFEQENGIRVHVGYRAPHPELNAHLAALPDPPYDPVSTYTKYAPSQLRYLAPIDEAGPSLELHAFYESPLYLTRIGGRLFGIPRNIDTKLLHYRTDLIESPPAAWDDLARMAVRLSTEQEWERAHGGESQEPVLDHAHRAAVPEGVAGRNPQHGEHGGFDRANQPRCLHGHQGRHDNADEIDGSRLRQIRNSR